MPAEAYRTAAEFYEERKAKREKRDVQAAQDAEARELSLRARAHALSVAFRQRLR
jgi:hypothetical protein